MSTDVTKLKNYESIVTLHAKQCDKYLEIKECD